jgi:hypothetical protein
MPLPGYGNLTSSQGSVGGAKYTRLQGPALVGQLADNTSGGPSYAPGAVIMVQSTASPITAPGVLGTAAATVSRGAYIYIPQTTGAIATSSFADGESAPPYSDCGAVLVWDAGNDRLLIYSTASGAGVWKGTNVGVTTSAGGGTFTSS